MKKCLLLYLLMSFVMLQSGVAQPTPADTADANQFTDVEAFMDGTIQSYMEENHIAGAMLVITQNGQPLLLKGYGVSDVEQQTPVQPNSTLFRIGSISKLFVWTAVMQQVERGNLDLNSNINQYLGDLQIPETYPEPITLKHLMTHTAGFEERVIGLFARDSSAVRPLEEILAEEMPERVRPPGKYASYSNHGTSIAAYVVEQVAGLEFEEYVQRNIMQPLGMNATTFNQPLPDSMQPRISKGYAYQNGEYVEKSFEYVPLAPVGAASTTAADMIPFMQAHLNLGQYQGAAILDSTTAQLMQSSAFRHAEPLNPMRYGFYDMSQNGVEIFGHGGDTFWFHSLMALFPEQDLGFFLSFNSEGGAGSTSKVLEAFVDRYFPAGNPPDDTLSVDDEYLQQFTGDYRPNRYPHSRLTKIMALMSTFPVTAAEDGRLKTMRGEEGEFWIPVESLTFRNTKNQQEIVFEQNSGGDIIHLFSDDVPVLAFEKVPFTASQGLHFSIFGIAVLALSVTLLYWPAAYLIRRSYRPSLQTTDPLPVGYKIIAWCNSLLLIIFYAGMAVSLGNPESIVYGVPTIVKVLLVLPLISLFLTLLMVYLMIKIWDQSLSGPWSRASYSLLSIIFLVSLWQLYYWNLIGFNY